MRNITITLSLLLLLTSCTSNNDFSKGKELLENQGYTNITNTGYSFFCCSKDDRFSTGFKALDGNGRVVEGCICSDFLKGITIRYN